MRVTLHYKHTNHSWLRYCSEEIIGLKSVWLPERFSLSFAESEKPGLYYILRGFKSLNSEVILLSLTVCDVTRAPAV